MFDRLPQSIQKRYYQAENLLVANMHDPRLHSKRLKLKTVVFSARITRDYRMLFYVEPENTIVLFAIGHRKDVYKKI